MNFLSRLASLSRRTLPVIKPRQAPRFETRTALPSEDLLLERPATAAPTPHLAQAVTVPVPHPLRSTRPSTIPQAADPFPLPEPVPKIPETLHAPASQLGAPQSMHTPASPFHKVGNAQAQQQPAQPPLGSDTLPFSAREPGPAAHNGTRTLSLRNIGFNK